MGENPEERDSHPLEDKLQENKKWPQTMKNRSFRSHLHCKRKAETIIMAVRHQNS